VFNYFTNLYVLLCLKIFMLNARLATTESMTHDVIRDMLGVKMNMTTFAVRIQFFSLYICKNISSYASKRTM